MSCGPRWCAVRPQVFLCAVWRHSYRGMANTEIPYYGIRYFGIGITPTPLFSGFGIAYWHRIDGVLGTLRYGLETHCDFTRRVMSCRRRQVPNGRDIRKGNAGINAGFEGSFSSSEETSLVLNLRCAGEMEGRLQSEPTGGWLKELKSPCLSRHFSARQGNTRIPYS